MSEPKPEPVENVIIIGAGPCGLSTALELQTIGIEPLLIEKQTVVYSIYQYPTTIPAFNPDSMETTIPGLYIAGVIAAGREANEIFIESGRHHGQLIAKHIQSRQSS